jgi:hypothetical protein
VAADEVEAKAVETAKVTAAPDSGNSASHGGNSSQPGLGEHVDVYVTEPKSSALLGQQEAIPLVSEPPPKADFPFLTLLGDSSTDNTPGQVIDTTI